MIKYVFQTYLTKLSDHIHSQNRKSYMISKGYHYLTRLFHQDYKYWNTLLWFLSQWAFHCHHLFFIFLIRYPNISKVVEDREHTKNSKGGPTSPNHNWLNLFSLCIPERECWNSNFSHPHTHLHVLKSPYCHTNLEIH